MYYNKKTLDQYLCRKETDAMVVIIAATILHETAHWSDFVNKDDGYRGEEGFRLERDIFGGKLDFWAWDLEELWFQPSGKAKKRYSTKHEIRQWADPDWWKDK